MNVMAAKEAAPADESSCHSFSGFYQPQSPTSSGRFQPPAKHWIARVTGGLEEIYTKIQSGWQHVEEDFSKCINDDQFFQPHSKVGLLAGRYQVVRVLGRGNSSTIVQAQDTFRPGLHQVAIKILKPEYYALGYQESQLLTELNKADVHDFSGVIKLLNTFTLGKAFFCMTFELLQPWPLYQMFKKISDKPQKLPMIRKVAVRMLQILGFLGQQNVIHADLKPENILSASENLTDGIRVIDFGNAIHCVYEELSLYYDEFELQTLLYRAPEVVLGLPFGQEIDMWSLGCILAEFYMGKPLFWTKQKEELLTQMTSLLGPLPAKVYQRAKYFTLYKDSLGQPASFMDTYSNLGSKLGCMDFKLVSFIQGMLALDPSERLTVAQAIQHPFLAPEMAIKFVLPTKTNGAEPSSLYSAVDITPAMYNFTPAGTTDARNKHQSSLDLLRHGTTSGTSSHKAIHVVAPFSPSKVKIPKSTKEGPKSEPEVEGTNQGRLQRTRNTTCDRDVRPSRPLVTRSAPTVKEEAPSEHQSTADDTRVKEPVEPSVQSVKVDKPSIMKGLPRRPTPRLSNVSAQSRHRANDKHHVDISRPGPSQCQRKDLESLKSVVGLQRSTLQRNSTNVTYSVCKDESERSKDDSIVLLPVDTPPKSKEDSKTATSQGKRQDKETGKGMTVKEAMSSTSHAAVAGRSPSSSQQKKSQKAINRMTEKLKQKGFVAGQTVKRTKRIISETKSPLLTHTQSADCKKVASPQFTYLDQQKEEAITQKNEDLGLNIQKLQNSPKLEKTKPCVSSIEARKGNKRTKPVSSPGIWKVDSVGKGKEQVISDDGGAPHDMKEVTLLTRIQDEPATKLPKRSGKTKPAKCKVAKVVSDVHIPHSANAIGEGTDRTTMPGRTKRRSNQNEVAIYDFIQSPVKQSSHPGSRKRSLQGSGVRIVDSVGNGKGQVISDDGGASHDMKEVTLLTRIQDEPATKLPKQSGKTKPAKYKVTDIHIPYSASATGTGVGKDRTTMTGRTKRRSNQNEGAIYDFIPSPVKQSPHPGSRKRSLQGTSDKKGKRSRVKPQTDIRENRPAEGSFFKGLDNPSIDSSSYVQSTALVTAPPSPPLPPSSSLSTTSVSFSSKGCQPHSRKDQHSKPSPAKNMRTKKSKVTPPSSTASSVASSVMASSPQRNQGHSSDTDKEDNSQMFSETSKGQSHHHKKSRKSDSSASESKSARCLSQIQASPSRFSSASTSSGTMSSSSSLSSRTCIPPPSPSGSKSRSSILHSIKSSPADQIKRLFSAPAANSPLSGQHRTLPENKGSSITLMEAESENESSDEQDDILLL